MPDIRLSREAGDDSRLVRECRNGDQRAFEALVLKYQDQVYNVAYRMVGDREEAMDVSQETFIKAFQRLETFDTKMPFRAWLLKITTNAAIDGLRRRGRSRETYTDEIGQTSARTAEGREVPGVAGLETRFAAGGAREPGSEDVALSNAGGATAAEGGAQAGSRRVPRAGETPPKLRTVSLGGFDPPAPERENPENVSLSNETAGIVHDALWELPDNYRAVMVLHHLEGMSYSEIGKVLGVPRNTAKTWGHRAHGMLCESLEGVI